MKRAIFLGGFAVLAVAAQAQTIDDFTTSSPSYVLPLDPNYGPNDSTAAGTLFDTRDMAASNFDGGRRGDFKVTDHGHGHLVAHGHHAGGELDLTYYNSTGPVDLSADGAITLDIAHLSSPMDLVWGFYSGGWTNESSANVLLTGTGVTTLNFSSLGGNPLVSNDIQSLFFELTVPKDGKIVLDGVSAGPAATPEPAPMAAMGLGVGILALKRRKRS